MFIVNYFWFIQIFIYTYECIDVRDVCEEVEGLCQLSLFLIHLNI